MNLIKLLAINHGDDSYIRVVSNFRVNDSYHIGTELSLHYLVN